MPTTGEQKKIAFPGRKCEAGDARLDPMATREELWAQPAETRRHFEVVAEGLRTEIRHVAEGHQFLVDGQARILVQMERMERELAP